MGKHEDDTLEMRMTNQPKDDAQDDISIFFGIFCKNAPKPSKIHFKTQ